LQGLIACNGFLDHCGDRDSHTRMPWDQVVPVVLQRLLLQGAATGIHTQFITAAGQNLAALFFQNGTDSKCAERALGRALPERKELKLKTYLDVPYGDHYRAKNLGARWDPARQSWFVPDAVDLTPFLKWVPGLPPLDKEVRRVLRSAKARRDRH
jgi:hypothetical protein